MTTVARTTEELTHFSLFLTRRKKGKESSLAYCRFRSQNVPLIITGNDHTQTQLITAPIK
jgi:hypothetical protein